MNQNSQGSHQKTEKSQITAEEYKQKFQNPKSRGKFFIGHRKRTQCRQSHHNHHNGTDNIRIHSRLPDNQAAYNSNGVPVGSRKPHAGLPQQFKGHLHQNNLHHCRKGNSLSGRRQRQQKIRGKNLSMEIGHGKVQPRKRHGKKRSQIPEHSCKRRNFPPTVIVVAGLNKRVVRGRQNQRHRRIIRQQHNPSL